MFVAEEGEVTYFFVGCFAVAKKAVISKRKQQNCQETQAGANPRGTRERNSAGTESEGLNPD